MIAGIGQSTWQDYIAGTYMVLMFFFFIGVCIVVGANKLKTFLSRFEKPSSVDQTLAEMAMAARAAQAERRVN